MRYESRVTSLSWIPSEAITGGTRAASMPGLPTTTTRRPANSGDIEELRLQAADRFRFANVLKAWIETLMTRAGSPVPAMARTAVAS